jgi:hypothetical protein
MNLRIGNDIVPVGLHKRFAECFHTESLLTSKLHRYLMCMYCHYGIEHLAKEVPNLHSDMIQTFFF